MKNNLRLLFVVEKIHLNYIHLFIKQVIIDETSRDFIELIQQMLSNLDGELMKQLIVAFLTTEPACNPQVFLAQNPGNSLNSCNTGF